MLCQKCSKNEANIHMKQIVNGMAAEIHLCHDCARSLGYTDEFGTPGIGFGDILKDVLFKNDPALSSVRCHLCGKSFDEIAESGMVGCAECYNTFYDKLLPSIRKIHGKASHIGKQPGSGMNKGSVQLDELQQMLSKAIDEQNFELAAALRDEIISLRNGGETK